MADELSSMSVDRYVVVADAATSIVADAGINIDMIVTDLDGIVEDQISLNSDGTVTFIHAHGDNQTALDRYVGRFVGPVVGTCQCPPPTGMHNLGGFTDGDRAVFLADHFAAKDITLVGFDFGSDRGRVNPADYEDEIDLNDRDKVKMRKLTWANVLIAMLDNPAISFYR